MAYIYANVNPKNKLVNDCVVRAISLATGKTWDEVFWDLTDVLFYEKETCMDSNKIWGEYLERKGYPRYHIADSCPMCYTLNQFCKDNPKGVYVVGTGTHAIAVIDGDFYDTFNSGQTTPLYYFFVEE